jgi:reductive dehalogenase
MHKFKRVDKPTTEFTGKISRVRASESALSKAARGEYGPAIQQAFHDVSEQYDLVSSLYAPVEYMGMMMENPVKSETAPQHNDPEKLSDHIKRYGYFLKADIIGICRIPENAVYSHTVKGTPIDLEYDNAIVIVVGKDYDSLYASTGRDWIAKALDFNAYRQLAVISQIMANYIRRLGYKARPQHLFVERKPDTYRVLLPPLLLEAGIGEASRAGIVVNPYLGLSFKAAAVLTTMPLKPDKPIDFGLQDFCDKCGICAEMCPSNAITKGGKVLYNGRMSWKLDVDRCLRFFLTNSHGTGCNMCVKVCPWTRPVTWNHNLMRSLMSRSRLARRIAIKAESFLKDHRRAHPDKKWWFDKIKADNHE